MNTLNIPSTGQELAALSDVELLTMARTILEADHALIRYGFGLHHGEETSLSPSGNNCHCLVGAVREATGAWVIELEASRLVLTVSDPSWMRTKQLMTAYLAPIALKRLDEIVNALPSTRACYGARSARDYLQEDIESLLFNFNDYVLWKGEASDHSKAAAVAVLDQAIELAKEAERAAAPA